MSDPIPAASAAAAPRSCPDDATIAALLDRELPEARAAELRAHLEACDACLARHGEALELALWLPLAAGAADAAAARSRDDLSPTEPESARHAAAARRRRALATAAALVALATLSVRAVWRSLRGDAGEPALVAGGEPRDLAPATSRAAPFQVYEAISIESERGPAGARALVRSRRDGALAGTDVMELRRDPDGLVTRHEWFEPRDAAATEKPK